MASPQQSKNDDTRKTYSLLVPDAFDFNQVQKFEIPEKIEAQKDAPSVQYVDPMVPGGKRPPEQELGSFDDLGLDPLLRKSIRGSGIPKREVYREAPSAESLMGSRDAEAERKLKSLNVPSHSLASPEKIAEILLELDKVKKEVKDQMVMEESRLRGAKSSIKAMTSSDNPLGKTGSFYAQNAVSEMSSLAYTPFHWISKKMDWEIFSEPPTTLVAEQNRMIREIKKERDYRESVITQMKGSLGSFNEKFSELENLHTALQGESDPGRQLTLIKNTQEKVREASEILTTAIKTDDPRLKKEWGDLRKSVNKGLAGIDKQLMYAEVGLHATEKTLIIGGAIIATVPTAGGSLGVLGGLGTGALIGATGGGSQMLGHGLGHSMMGTSSQFNVEDEAKEVISDIKDGSLYALGGVASNMALARMGGMGFSSAEAVAGKGLNAGLQAFAKSPLEGTKLLFKNAPAAVWNSSRFYAGGATRGLMTETPAALADTLIVPVALGGESLDPSGRLDQMGVPKWKQLMRSLTVRLGTAAAGGGLGHGFQGMRGGVAGLGQNANGFRGAAMRSLPVRTSLRAASEIVTVPEFGLDVVMGAYTEGIVTGWYYGKDGQAREPDLEQIIVSTLAGHMSGRSFGAADTGTRTQKEQAARNAATRLQTTVNQRAAVESVQPDRVVTAVGHSDNVTLRRDPTLANPIGRHLGARNLAADQVSHRKQHRVAGEAAMNIDSRVGRRVSQLADTAADQIQAIVENNGNRVGASRLMAQDRRSFRQGLDTGLKERTALLAQLRDPRAPLTPEGQALLREHIDSYAKEFRGDDTIPSRSIAEWFWRLGDRTFHSKLDSKQRVGFSNNDLGPQSTNVKLGLLRRFVDRIPLVRGTGGLADSLALGIENYSTRAARGLRPISDGLGLTALARGTSRLASGLGIALYSAPTPSLWGSYGVAAAGVYGGVGLASGILRRAAYGIGIPSVAAARRLGADRFFAATVYGRGNGGEAGHLLAKRIEGEHLLNYVQEVNRRQPGTIDAALVNRLQTELAETQARFDRANARLSGFFGAGQRGYERFTEVWSRNPASQNTGRMVSDDALQAVERVSRRVINQARLSNQTPSLELIEGRFGDLIRQNRPNHDQIERLSRAVLREGSTFEDGARGDLQRRLVRLVDNEIAPLRADDTRRVSLQRVREIISETGDPLFALERQLDLNRAGNMNRARTRALAQNLVQHVRDGLRARRIDVDEMNASLRLLYADIDMTRVRTARRALNELSELIATAETAGRLNERQAERLRGHFDSRRSHVRGGRPLSGVVLDVNLAEAHLSLVQADMQTTVMRGVERITSLGADPVDASNAILRDIQNVLDAHDHRLGYRGVGRLGQDLRRAYQQEARIHQISQTSLIASPEWRGLLTRVQEGNAASSRQLGRMLREALGDRRSDAELVDLWNADQDFRRSSARRLNSFYSQGNTIDVTAVRNLVHRDTNNFWRNTDVPGRFQPTLEALNHLARLEDATRDAVIAANNTNDMVTAVRDAEPYMGNVHSLTVLIGLREQVVTAISRNRRLNGRRGADLQAHLDQINEALFELSR